LSLRPLASSSINLWLVMKLTPSWVEKIDLGNHKGFICSRPMSIPKNLRDPTCLYILFIKMQLEWRVIRNPPMAINRE
jgi:hypothetical protein